MVIRLDIEIWEIGKGDTEKEGGGKGGGWVGKWYGAGFCGLCVCLSVFLLL
jgi:hypothetical protein